jgi:hypothetical protein
MKKYLPWLILILIILGIGAFIINLTTPSTSRKSKIGSSGLILDLKKCGQIEKLAYCSGPYSCGVRCNSCGCETPICSYNDDCRIYFETNFKISQ